MPGLDCTLDQRSLPLAFCFGDVDPDSRLACDMPDCAREDGQSSRLCCGHSFHLACVSEAAGCPLCVPRLLAKVQQVSAAFNQELMAKPDEHQVHCGDDDDGDDDDGSDDETTLIQRTSSSTQAIREDMQQKLSCISLQFRPQFPNKSAAPPRARPEQTGPKQQAAQKTTACYVCHKLFTPRGVGQHKRKAHPQ